MKSANLLFFALLVTLFPPLSAANTISQQRDSDGTIEFSNQTNTGPTGSTIIYKSEANDIPTFSDQRPTDVSFEVLRFNCFACNPGSKINWHNVKLNTKDYDSIVRRTASRYQIDPALVRALIHAESAFKAKAVSPAGAQGLMQLMPATAKQLGVNNALNPQQNIQGGVKYLAQLLREFDGNINLATAAYNAGPGAVKKYGGIPPYKETQVYVERVNILYQRYKKLS